MKKSAIPHFGSGLGVIAAWSLGKDQIVGYHYKSLVYSDLHDERSKDKVYREGVMLVTTELLWRWANELFENATDRDRVEQSRR